MNRFQQAMIALHNIAHARGYTEKVVGDYAYRNRRGGIIRYKVCRGNVLTIWEQGRGTQKLKVESG